MINVLIILKEKNFFNISLYRIFYFLKLNFSIILLLYMPQKIRKIKNIVKYTTK